jgi:O-succinylbenzoate synthase
MNIKPSRVGGYLAASAIHDLCAAQGIPVWCGGMLETGVGRAANLALAAMANFTLPGDISATARYFTEDITAPFILDGGHIAVPDGPGIGVEVLPDILDRLTIRHEVCAESGRLGVRKSP